MARFHSMAMSYTILVALALASTLLPSALAATACVPEPVAAAIGNVTLSNNHVARGIQVSIGTPAQAFVFMPQWPLNNSFVYGTDGHCSPDFSSAKCTTFRGGAYNTIGSSTRKVPAPGAYPADSSPWSSVAYSADTFSLGVNSSSPSAAGNSTNTPLDGFAFGVPLNDLGQQGYHPMNALGLGFNSSLLNSLKATGQIASRTWSMFWGLNGAASTAQMEGVFVLGGYDAAKVVDSQKYTLPLADAASICPSRMVLSITDMILNFSNGTNASIFPGTASTALQACITPDYPVLMTLPTDPYFQNIETLTNQSISEQRSDGLVFFANRYLPNAANVYTGDLTIKFQSGLSVRVPNDQLIVPDRYIDASGAVQANSSGLDTTILSIQNVNAGDMTQLGRQFLSAAYVMLNQDANEFTLWQANPTTNRELVAVDEKNAKVTSFCSKATSTAAAVVPEASSSTAATVPTAVPSAVPNKPLSVGIIAGVAVGGTVVAAAFIAAVVLLILRKRRRSRAVAAAAAIEDSMRRKFDPSRGVASMSSASRTELVGSVSNDIKNSAQTYEAYEIDGSARIELMALQESARRKTLHYELQG